MVDQPGCLKCVHQPTLASHLFLETPLCGVDLTIYGHSCSMKVVNLTEFGRNHDQGKWDRKVYQYQGVENQKDGNAGCSRVRRLWRITPCLIGTSYVPFRLRAGSPSNNSLVSTSNSRFLLLCSVLLSWKAQDLLSSSWSVPNLRENGKWRKGENPYLPTKYTVDAMDTPWHEQKSLVGSVRYGISPQTVRHGYCTQNR